MYALDRSFMIFGCQFHRMAFRKYVICGNDTWWKTYSDTDLLLPVNSILFTRLKTLGMRPIIPDARKLILYSNIFGVFFLTCHTIRRHRAGTQGHLVRVQSQTPPILRSRWKAGKKCCKAGQRDAVPDIGTVLPDSGRLRPMTHTHTHTQGAAEQCTHFTSPFHPLFPSSNPWNNKCPKHEPGQRQGECSLQTVSQQWLWIPE